MLGLIVNLGAIAVGSAIGVPARKKISGEVSGGVLTAIGLCVLFIGITGLFTGANSIVILLSFAIGTFIGAGLDLNGKLEQAGQKLEMKFTKRSREDVSADMIESAAADDLDGFSSASYRKETSDGQQSLMNACLTFFLVSCTGAYTITACFAAGLGDNTMLYIKAILDFVVSMTMAAGMGIGVMLAIIPMLVYQGLLILCSSLLSPLLSESMIAALSCAGALITVVIGTNMIGATHLKAVNYLPAIVLAPLFQMIAEMLPL